MFDKMTHNDEETSFSEAYRSEILNKGQEKEKSILPKVISILLLIVVISAISIFGYNYFSSSSSNNTPVTEPKQEEIKKVQKVEEIEKIEEHSLPTAPPESMMIDNFEDLEIIQPAIVTKVEATPTATKNDIDQIANQMKLELSKELDMQSSTSPKKIDPTPVAPIQKGEQIYMEELRKLSEQINREAI